MADSTGQARSEAGESPAELKELENIKEYDAYTLIKQMETRLGSDPEDRGPVQVLCRLLKHPVARVRSFALKGLGRAAGLDMVNPLLDALNDADHEVRMEAATVLGEIDDPRARLALALALLDDNIGVHVEAFRALYGLRDPQIIEPLLDQLDNKFPHIRVSAVQLLGLYRDDRAQRALMKALFDPWTSVRSGALAGLHEHGDRRAVEAIEEYIQERCTDHIERFAAEKAIEAIKQRAA